ncbi:MAG: phosphotransferase [Clostridium sp.]|nr:phosphotransferase [Clostridium sp.]
MEQEETTIRELCGQAGLTLSHGPICSIEKISQAGSSRRYRRVALADGTTVVATFGDNFEENGAFIRLSRHFRSKQLPVPEVLAVSADGRAYLQTDAGRRSLFDLIEEARRGGDSALEGIRPLLRDAVAMLPRFQFDGLDGLDTSLCYPREAMDNRCVMWDLNYFKYEFLKVFDDGFDEDDLENEFSRLADMLADDYAPKSLIMRDYQSRNLMVGDDGRLTLIDFQGARLGSPFYDAVSFVFQTRAAFPGALRRELMETYRDALAEYLPGMTEGEFRAGVGLNRLFRTLQVLGAYGFRGLVERKARFLSVIPAAVGSLASLPADVLGHFPIVRGALERVAENFRRRNPQAVPPADSVGLTVDVISFSYRKGVPVDFSGNGGGFVFDCRAMHNPGRYDRFKPLTGRDSEVIAFLCDNGECDRFVDGALAMVSPSVERYLERGFTRLQIAFGCTGGRHRSVYCADLLARRLARAVSGRRVSVRLIHREQDIFELL